MWIITKGGDAVNLALARTIYVQEGNGFEVRAVFDYDAVVIKTFNNADDAKKFIWDLMSAMNSAKGFSGWTKFNATDDDEEEVNGTQGDLADKPLHKGENLIDGIPL